MIQVETERLLLRNYKATDCKDVFQYFSREEVSTYEDFDPMSEKQVEDMIDEWRDLDNRLAAVLKTTQKVIGSIGYWIDDEGHYCIDYDFNPEYYGNGYASEAGQALVSHLFETTDINAVYGDCDVRNTASWRLLERLGFRRIRQLDDQSYKKDKKGDPIRISTFLYELKRPESLK